MFSLCLLLAFVQASEGFSWTTSSYNNGAIIPACPGQTVTFPWGYSLSNYGEHTVDIEWHFTPQTGVSRSTILLGSYEFSTFTQSTTPHRQVEYVANAGIRLRNVQHSDAGEYSVHVNLNHGGSAVSNTRNAHLVVSDHVTYDGHLHARVASEAVYDSNRDEYVIQLECGNFRSEWRSGQLTVKWRTPDHSVLYSTGYNSYGYYLHVAKPFHSGDYTCFVDHSALPSSCLPSESTVRLDASEARATLLEAEVKSLKSKLKEATKRVHFTAVPYGAKSDNSHALFDHVLQQSGGGYSTYSGRFTAPVSGVYLFMITANSHSSRGHVKATLHISNGAYVSALGEYHTSGATQMAAHLNTGDYAWVVLDEGHLEEYFDSAFVGVLVQPDV